MSFFMTLRTWHFLRRLWASCPQRAWEKRLPILSLHLTEIVFYFWIIVHHWFPKGEIITTRQKRNGMCVWKYHSHVVCQQLNLFCWHNKWCQNPSPTVSTKCMMSKRVRHFIDKLSSHYTLQSGFVFSLKLLSKQHWFMGYSDASAKVLRVHSEND